ncbi:MAG: 3-carboxyethylcatechol 2,3-dioxygenase [Phenylobacterium sp.]|uniref:DODA-type extradiol aromatic ring-opening family dioxygenase n=1 Tax=Phenylobacterium sp. TaxID=1871053 RepID=UPI0025F47262|nr:hypothetical protein [Phenylobacterium sp.]MCA6225483.1 3-carboxyethylcatechol 2,3-dioxygenase [Phenylobacterium sp.]MCA6233218.1 3-carboxyethylcatechol 2,3-dioxygenase [Phenylobacterium sp.]MCA6235915.1 3-carboxyethylcatechol 2,3-dioxygenase [Phenylobacterium sp.]MCA6248593.1 3-carboxyethylcatechol 2,3-dioxygenase [Phenylobacterium sp.]MCA6251749.1 3-carboxyethylcatechol 2,3-dioxygenase [Phenylobacterium sp.]
MSVHMICASHSPLMEAFQVEPPEHQSVVAAFEARARLVEAFQPELVIEFGSDHLTGFHYHVLPPICVGLSARAVADIGGYPGDLRVPMEEARALVAHLGASDLDVAIAHEMVIDHGFSQALHRLTGAIDRYPVIPIFLSAIAGHRPSPRRARLLGKAVGEFARGLGKRVLILGTGGLAHDPSLAFPDLENAPEEHRDYLVHGAAAGKQATDLWLDRVNGLTLMASQMIASGALGPEQIKLNASWDQDFLARICSGRLDEFDDWTTDRMITDAGSGAAECLQWIAAAAAAQAAGCEPPVIDLCVPVLTYIIGVGVIHTPLPAIS